MFVFTLLQLFCLTYSFGFGFSNPLSNWFGSSASEDSKKNPDLDQLYNSRDFDSLNPNKEPSKGEAFGMYNETINGPYNIMARRTIFSS